MNRLAKAGTALAVICSLFLLSTQTAYAHICAGAFEQPSYAYYIDPGTGSIVIQVLIGAVVAGAAMIGVYRLRVKAFLSGLFGRGGSDNRDGESEDNE